MGTFHENTHELHGITVVIDAADGSLIVGRFHEEDGTHALLLDADTHREGEGGKSNAEWLEAACHEIERLRGQLRPSRQDLEDEIDDLREQIDCAIERICDDNFSPTKAATE